MGLFTDPPDKEVIAYDLLGHPNTRNLKNFRWRVSVYGLCKENDKILVQHNPVVKSFGLPGGAIEIGEKIEEALKREFIEETGLEVEPLELLAATEDIFTVNDEDAFSVLLLYKTKIVGGAPLLNSNDEDSDGIVWMTKEELSQAKLFRVFTKFSKFF